MPDYDPKLAYIEDVAYVVERPKIEPSIIVQCPRCKGTIKKQITARGEMDDYYWRYFKCLPCKKNYWVGVRRLDSFTVITIKTPKQGEGKARLTWNLPYMLPPGHPAVTPDYNMFLAGGRLKDEFRPQYEARFAPMQVSEEPTTPEPSVTSISNGEAPEPSSPDPALDQLYRSLFDQYLEHNYKGTQAEIDAIPHALKEPAYRQWLKQMHPNVIYQPKQEQT